MSKKKFFALISSFFVLISLFSGCAAEPEVEERNFKGNYVGYSWKDEKDGVKLEDSSQYIQTILELDDKGIIVDANMMFFVKKDGFWIPRESGNAYVKIDYNVNPVIASPGEDYKAGTSMFTVHTADMMSFYALGVDENGTVAVGIVDPITRYLYEMKFEPDFDFNTEVKEVTIGSGRLVPTIRTSSGGLIKPSEWESFSDKNILEIDELWSHVINDEGILKGITSNSTIKEFLEALGVEFVNNQPENLSASYGYFGLGGWQGNHDAIENWLIGKNATEVTSLVDWNNPRYANNVNEDNFFGLDTVSGATRTVQNSIDTISGATVRISRESTSYQRALIDAGILTEEEIIKGRF